jgi:DNA-directed RNA polymerase specialized sigma24 family protein
MADPSPFPELLARLRAGDADAVGEFVAAYEPFIRRSLRRRMARGARYPVADSDDLCQSVLGSFLLRVAAGEYHLADAADLERLLVTMVRNKVAAVARREGGGPIVRASPRPEAERDDDPSGDSIDDPARVVAARDLLGEVRRRLAPDDLALLDRRQAGESWEAIADAVGGTAVALRKRLSRALRAITDQLGVGWDDE